MRRSEMVTKITALLNTITPNLCEVLDPEMDESQFASEVLRICEQNGMIPPTFHKQPTASDTSGWVFRNGRWLQEWEPENEKK